MEESDAGWRGVSAGLVVMRLVDQWIADGPSASCMDSWAVSAVREAIAAMIETTPIKRILTSVVDVMTSATATDMHALCPRLMAYGQALEYEAKWSLAADVYATIVAHAHPVEDSDLAVAAHLQLAFCLRTLGDLDSAAVSYRQASRIAYAANDMIGILRARLGDAKIAIGRGNLPEAEHIVNETIACADAKSLTEIMWRGLNERVLIAGLRGQHDNVIKYAYQSLAIAPGQRDRDRGLHNIATAFRHLGLLDVARDAFLVLTATAQEQYVRWISGLNLMELAAIQGSELQFDKYRRDYESAEFTPVLRITYLLNVGRGYHALHQSEAAIPYLEQALQLAEKHHLNQLVFQAEAALAEVRQPTRRSDDSTHVPITDDMRCAIHTIQGLKEMAGV